MSAEGVIARIWETAALAPSGGADAGYAWGDRGGGGEGRGVAAA